MFEQAITNCKSVLTLLQIWFQCIDLQELYNIKYAAVYMDIDLHSKLKSELKSKADRIDYKI